MAYKQIIILYEDKRGPIAEFGPHRFLIACVYDKIDADRVELEKSLNEKGCCRPLNGAEKVLKACWDNFENLSDGGQGVLAIFDGDRVAEKVNLPRSAADSQVIARVKEKCPSPVRLSVAIIRKNIESLIEAARECKAGISEEQVKKAVEKKDLEKRDIVFKALARLDRRDIRDCILQKVPSFQAAVDETIRILQGSSS